MGIESFYERNRRIPGIDFRGYMKIKREEKGELGEKKSLLRIFVEQVIEEGANGLRTLAKECYSRSGRKRRFSDKQLKRQATEIENDFAAIVLGNAVISLEEVLVDGHFNYFDFVQRVNDSLLETPLGVALPQADEDMDFISRKQLNGMQVAVREDKTFAKFFENEHYERLLPKKLLDFLDNKYIAEVKVGSCVQKILPEYKRLAESVVG